MAFPLDRERLGGPRGQAQHVGTSPLGVGEQISIVCLVVDASVCSTD